MLSAIVLMALVTTMSIVPAAYALTATVTDDCGGKTVYLNIFQRATDQKLTAYILAPWQVFECGGIFSKVTMSLDTIKLEITDSNNNICHHTIHNNMNSVLPNCPLIEGPETFQYKLVLRYDNLWQWETYTYHSSFTV